MFYYLSLILLIFSFILQAIIFVIGLYCIYITVMGWSPFDAKKTIQQKDMKYNKFAIIIPAHNEETVIKNTIESLKCQSYPVKYFDIFIIADNCIDNTAQIAKREGALVLERNDSEKRGKGYALQWAFDRILTKNTIYDAICVFDADNLISSLFLDTMNQEINSGKDVIQGYIDSKNPFDSWISCSYSIAFWLSNRIYQEPRYNLSLSCGLCGTGFCIKKEVFDDVSWSPECLTEDLDFTMNLIVNKKKVSWSRNAVVYDEKPLTLKQSLNQRLRWMQGHIDCSKRYLKTLLTIAIKNLDLQAFDAVIYLLQPIRFVLFGFATLIAWTHAAFPNAPLYVIGYSFPVQVWTSIIILQLLYGPFVILYEKKYDVRILLGFIRYPFYCLTWLPIAIRAFVESNNKEWHHTKHTRNISISEMEIR